MILQKKLNKPKKIPGVPGVYFFMRNKKPIYIGKAANLKKRLASYFNKNLSEKVNQLRKEATSVKWIELNSEIEALIKEAKLIKNNHPKYNILMRDDKNYFYAGITKERFPKIFVTHQPFKTSGTKTRFIGPFTSGGALKITLKHLRAVFPYCTCFKPHKRPCLNSQIGRCLGYCCLHPVSTSGQNTKTYQKNIKTIIEILSGETKKLLRELKKEMRKSVQIQDFESAAKSRNKIFGLENIFKHRLFLQDISSRKLDPKKSVWQKVEKNIRSILGLNKKITRVEGYDISNISGTNATGSMVVFINGYPDKSRYRKFKIKTVNQSNDVAMLKEIIKRRMVHAEWNFPDFMLIDGGRPQFQAVNSVLAEFKKTSSVIAVALAKKEEGLYIKNNVSSLRLDSLPELTANFLKNVRDESHRFAKKYHHKLREISYRI